MLGKMCSSELGAQALNLGLNFILTARLTGCVALGKILNQSECLPPNHVGNRENKAPARPVGRDD